MKLSLLLAGASILFAVALAQAAEASFPEVCKGEMTMDMGVDHSKMSEMMTEDHQKAGMSGMMQMHKDMMQGMMKKDADVAFVCGMIAHHQGAIDMAKVELQYGDDDWSKKMAQMIIEAQTKEIAEMTDWLKTDAK